jgi:hypothetical protein
MCRYHFKCTLQTSIWQQKKLSVFFSITSWPLCSSCLSSAETHKGLNHRKFLRLSKSKSFSVAPVAHTCNPSYLGGWDQEDCGSRPVWAKPHLQNNQSKMNWRYGGRIPALQARSPEFKPQLHTHAHTQSTNFKANFKDKGQQCPLNARRWMEIFPLSWC